MRQEREAPPSKEQRSDSTPATERERVRGKEDERYVPVILKRTDEARRHPDDILQAAIEAGVEQLERPPLSLFLSAVGAGLILAFTAMAAGVMSSIVGGLDAAAFERIAVGLVYPFGFIVCLMSGTELFTEHTATAVYPVLDQRSRIWRLLRLWVLVGAGNLIGTLIGAGLLTLAEGVVGARSGYILVAEHLVEPETVTLLASAVLAGFLMALGAWLILATPPTVSQLASIYIVTFLIGLGGLHHAIAGAAEMLTAFFITDEFSLREVSRFIGLALVGNLIGGSFFVAGLNYAHIRHSQPAQ